jgi:hexosaminidase
MRSISRSTAILATVLACSQAPRATAPTPSPVATPLVHAIIPVPTTAQLDASDAFVVDSTTSVVMAAPADAEVERLAGVLATMLMPTVKTAPRRLAAGEAPPPRSIALVIDLQNATTNPEGYSLAITRDRVTITAREHAGLFYGVQTIRQLLPWSIEHVAAWNRRLRIPVGRVVDGPRFAWRGAMLDVSRHFIGANDVKRFIDLLALYKLNRLHLHLADDQGWRIEIKSWPNLARHGGSTQVGGGPGGYYTQEVFADIVAYARARFVTIVPEIDMPGHTNAALASYPELNCNGVAPELYTGTRVGFSTLCVTRDTVYTFVNDVVREIGALVPTPYFHIGGDEVEKLTHPQYLAFVERVQQIVHANGKQMIGWGEIAPAALNPTTIVQHWKRDSSDMHAARGGRVIISQGKYLYLDMKYDSTTTLGLRWAGLIEVRDTYSLDPATLIPGVGESAIVGVEAPLWAETIVKAEDYEFMAFPRLIAVAEVGWSSMATRAWDNFSRRLGAHGPRLAALGVNFYRSPQIPWAIK